jgi:hypothetical protein
VQEERVLTRLPKTLALLGALLLAVFTVGAGASPAAAHGNHAHQVSTGLSRSAPYVWTAEALQWAQGHFVAASAEAQPEGPGRHSKSDCCCGTIMCHAGVTLTIDPFSFLCPTSARLIAEPSSGRPLRNLSGLERPPRSLDIA